MTERKPKRKIKDSVFANLFQDRKYLLQLYRTLHPEDHDAAEEDLTDITLQPILLNAEYNDLGFRVADRLMVMVESQSAWSVNIVVRALMYLVQSYHDYFKKTGQYLYGSGKVNMPRPELYVIFTGTRKNIPDTISLKADFFAGEKVAIDAEIKVLWRPEEDNIIGQYIIFCKVYNAQMRKHGRTRRAVMETIRICRERNVLREYLEDKEQEVVDIMMALYDEDYIYEAFWNDVEKKAKASGERKAREEAKREAKREVKKEVKKEVEKKEKETALRMLRAGEPPEKVALYMPELSTEEIRQLIAENLQPI